MIIAANPLPHPLWLLVTQATHTNPPVSGSSEAQGDFSLWHRHILRIICGQGCKSRHQISSGWFQRDTPSPSGPQNLRPWDVAYGSLGSQGGSLVRPPGQQCCGPSHVRFEPGFQMCKKPKRVLTPPPPPFPLTPQDLGSRMTLTAPHGCCTAQSSQPLSQDPLPFKTRRPAPLVAAVLVHQQRPCQDRTAEEGSGPQPATRD